MANKMKHWTKPLLWFLVLMAVAFVFYRAFQSSPVLVDVATIESGPLVVTVDDDGQTRVRERFTISSPMEGRLLRPPLKAGAPVKALETVIAEFEPRAPGLLDARARGIAEARAQSASAAVERAQALEVQAQVAHEYAKKNFDRNVELAKSGAGLPDELDRAERDARRAKTELHAAKLAIKVAEYELHLAQAGLVEEPEKAPHHVTLRSPIDGVVMRVLEESTRNIPAGTPILQVGNTEALEIVADYLSQDAVRVRPGMEVLVEGWNGSDSSLPKETLVGSVRLVEPSGFTKFSALGVEEQRVNVIIDPAEPLGDWKRLQDGYRVELQIVIWQAEDVIKVPTGALFRDGDDWAVFIVIDDEAQSRRVALGRRTGLEAEVQSGLRLGDAVVLYPSELIKDGTAVEAR